MQELWTSQDDAAEAALLEAAAQGDLLSALLAIEGAPEDDQADARATLHDWSERVTQNLHGADVHAQTRALTQVLGRDMDLRGDGQDYYRAENSLLTRVIEERRGLPILLSSIWIMVAAEAGILVQGIGMPGHFVARVGGPDGVLVDPFEGGRPMSRAACREVVAKLSQNRVTWQEEFLDPTPPLDLLERVLRNLFNTHHRKNDTRGLYRHIRLLASLRQDKPHEQLLHAQVSEEIGALGLAIDLYEKLIERFPKSPQAKFAATRIGPVMSRMRKLN